MNKITGYRGGKSRPYFVAASMLWCLALLCFSTAAAQTSRDAPPGTITGIVTDQNARAIAGADVFLYSLPVLIAQTRTDNEGRFTLNTRGSTQGTIFITHNGFSAYELEWNSSANGGPFTIVLKPAMLSEEVVVSATRIESRVGETAASVAVVSREDLADTAAVTIDDALRQVTGFQLFRRTSSRVANPTTQGVSLRGLGASGASRALVLADGVPLNDPFGAWVYWGRVPRESIERIEVLRGGASSLYGSGALGGAINILTNEPDRPHLRFSTSYGTQNTAEASLFAGTEWKGWGLGLAAEGFRTDGYIPIEEGSRGPIDVAADSRRGTVDLRIGRKFTENANAFARGSIFREDRGNGTPAQTNRTYIRQFTTGGDASSQTFGTLAVRLYIASQVYDQTFSAIADDRASENLLRLQRVPAEVFGFSGQWSRAVGNDHTLVAGFEIREVRGTSDETVIAQGRSTSLVSSGGRQRTFAVFGEDIFRVTQNLSIIAKLRYDHWKNFAGHTTTRSLLVPGQVTETVFPDRTESAFSPQLSVLFQATSQFSLFASAYRAFRAPTLNELYRGFRVGDVLTLANEDLRAERLTGAEAGVNFRADRPNIEVRTTFFWSEVDQAVANRTLFVTPNLITRQRQNLGRTRSRGVEVDLDYRPHRKFILTGGYLLVDATVVEFPENPALVGRMIPQIPRHQFTFQARYTDPTRFDLGLQGRGSSGQFDDDQNLLPLDPYFTLDALASKRIKRNLEVFAAIENLFDQRYEVGRTPVTTVGPPRTFRAGIRLNFGTR